MRESRRGKRRVRTPPGDCDKKQKDMEEVSLEVCLMLYDQTFRYFSIPSFTNILQSLSVSSSSSSSSSVTELHHYHIYDEPPVPVDAAISNILSNRNRLPVILADDDHFKTPFSLPGTPYFFYSTVVGSTLYCLGGDVDDIGIQYFDDIDNDRINRYPPLPSHVYDSPRPPPGNSIEDQFIRFIEVYNHHHFTPTPVNDLEGWGITDPEPEPEPEPSCSNNNNQVMDTTAVDVSETTASTSGIKGICHKAWMFDLRNPHLGWSQSKPLISPRLYPHLVSYQGKLYAFSGNHPSLPFAEVYDPLSHTWTQLPPAPFGRLADTRMFVVPLKGWNKIWVFSDDGGVDYTFHVRSGKWKKLGIARHIIPLFSNIMDLDLVAALNHDKNMVLYWISPQQKVYAYNLSTNELFMGAIPGTDRGEGYIAFPLIMHHLHRDIFCLIGDDLPSESTVLHVTILQVSTKPLPKSKSTNPVPSKTHKAPSKTRTAPPKPLNVAILACLSYPLEGCFNIINTYLLSDNI